MFTGPIVRSICFQQYVFTSTRLIVRVKSGFTQELYHRAMNSMELEEDFMSGLPKGQQDKAQKSTATGRLANLMAGDIDAIYQARDIIIILIGVPIGIIVAFVGLYKFLGWPALVGTFILLVTAPIPVYLSQMLSRKQRELKLTQDSRISLVSEYLASIRAIKYFAWEDAMTKHIEEARAR